MKIQSNKKINNINEESKASLKEFHQKQILSNIRYHKIFLFLLIIIDIGLICFIFFYKQKINEIKTLSNSYSSKINSQDNQISKRKSSLNYKLLNIAAINKSKGMRFSFIFENSEEFNTIKDLIIEYKHKIDETSKEFKYIKTFFIYQSIIDSDKYKAFIDNISFYEDILILIQTDVGNKFGIYINDVIVPNKNNEFESNTENIFLYSFETKKIYEYIGTGNKNKKSISFNKEKLLNLGDDELVIYNNYYSHGGLINHPLKSFYLSNDDNNIFTGRNGEFTIRNFEVLSFLQY